MPFIALLSATEKARDDGITYINLIRNQQDFKKIIVPEFDIMDAKKVDIYRRNYLLADYYNNVGSILFYKNCQFSKFYNEDDYLLEVFQNENSGQIIEMQKEIYLKNKHSREYDFFPSLTSFNYY